MEIPQNVTNSLLDPNPAEASRAMTLLENRVITVQQQQAEVEKLIASYQEKLDTNPMTLPLALGYAQMHGVVVDQKRPVIFTAEGKLVLNTVDVVPVAAPRREELPACTAGLTLDNNGFPLVGDLYDLLRKNGIDPRPFGRNKKKMLAELARLEEGNG
jgi:hypothetical protein